LTGLCHQVLQLAAVIYGLLKLARELVGNIKRQASFSSLDIKDITEMALV
jgi:hypothetical protein